MPPCARDRGDGPSGVWYFDTFASLSITVLRWRRNRRAPMLHTVQWKLHRTVWVVVTAHRRDALDALNEQVRTDDVARAVVNFRAALH